MTDLGCRWRQWFQIAMPLMTFFMVGSALADELRIAGTGNALGVMRLLAERYQILHPGDKVSVHNSIGSSGALKAVPKGAIDIGLISRPLTTDEAGTGIVGVEFAQTPTVIAVSARSSVRDVSREKLAAIYAGTLTRWTDGTDIRPLLRQAGDDNTVQLRSLSPEIAQAVDFAEKRHGLSTAVTDQEAADKLEMIPGAIGVTSMALIRAEKRELRPLSLDGVEPNQANCTSGVYPLMKRFFAISAATPSAAVNRFLAFLRSSEADRILRDNGLWRPR